MVNEPKLPEVVGYRASVVMRKPDGNVIQVLVMMDDWYSDEEVLEKLIVAYPAGTMGEVVESIKRKRGELPEAGNGVVSACIKHFIDRGDGARVWGWDESVLTKS